MQCGLFVENMDYLIRCQPQYCYTSRSNFEWARRELMKAKSAEEKYADRRRRDAEYRIGDPAWLKVSHLPYSALPCSKALRPRLGDPFKIIPRIRRVRDCPYRLPPSSLIRPVFHVSSLEPEGEHHSSFIAGESFQHPVGKDEYGVQGILKHMEDPTTRKLRYMVW